MVDDLNIPVLEGNTGPDTANRLGSHDSSEKSFFVTKLISSERVRSEITRICAEFRPERIDPDLEIGITEVEVALSVSTSAGVRLIGEATTAAQVSLRIKIVRT